MQVVNMKLISPPLWDMYRGLPMKALLTETWHENFFPQAHKVFQKVVSSLSMSNVNGPDGTTLLVLEWNTNVGRKTSLFSTRGITNSLTARSIKTVEMTNVMKELFRCKDSQDASWVGFPNCQRH